MSEFLDAAIEILNEYGESAAIYNRAGTSVATSVMTFSDEGAGAPDYYPEAGDNAYDEHVRTIYLPGNVALENGYRIVLPDGTFQVLKKSTPKEASTPVLHIAVCRRID